MLSLVIEEVSHKNQNKYMSTSKILYLMDSI